MPNEIVEIDCSSSEDEDQMLRITCSLSAATKTPFHIFNIRAKKPEAGLTAQNLSEIEAISRFCDAKVEGNFLKSKEIKFYPNEIQNRDFHVKVEPAGSITLLAQLLILPAIFSPLENPKPIKIFFDGGATDTFFSPTIDYFQNVFLKILEKINGKTEINILKRGYYPEGGSKVEIKIFPQKLKNLKLTERGRLGKIRVISGASEFWKEKMVAERQIAGIREILGELKLPLEEEVEYYQTQCPGSQICLIAEFENTVIGTDNLGKLGKRAEDVGKETAIELLKEAKSETCLDKQLASQILPYLALNKSKSSFSVSEVTERCKTNAWAIEKFIKGKFTIQKNLILWNPF
jgi:RNA 3'-phosphate cyclase